MLSIVAQSAALSAFSNIIAQLISNSQSKASIGSLDLRQVLTFIAYTILNTPINVWWQDWLEATFPGSEAPPTKGKPGGTAIPQSSAAKVRYDNIAKKFLLDQTIGAALNVLMFIVGVGALKGQGWGDIQTSVRQESLPIYYAGAKFWPLISLVSFLVVPVEKRVIVGSLAGVLWNIFLGLKAA